MAQSEQIRGLCPKCRELLEIPGQLEEFSCMYCGARLSPDVLLPLEPMAAAADVDAAACAAYYHDHILSAIADYQGIEKEMTKSQFPVAFDRYQEGNEETFRQLQLAYYAGALTLEDAASDFLDQLEHRWDNRTKRQSRSAMADADRFIVAIFLVPMVRRLGLSISEDYCATLHRQWLERFPKDPFQLGTYDALAGGFQKKFMGLCFITTAVCRHDNKPDDCAELTAFRSFRDGYLRACPDGPDLIDQYYDVAPAIVAHIELSGNRDAKYAQIRDQYLQPCFEDIRNGRLARCKDRYISMVQALQKEYLS